MKKIVLSLGLVFGLTLAANAVIFTTSCGTSYDIPNGNFASTTDMINFLIAADYNDCP